MIQYRRGLIALSLAAIVAVPLSAASLIGVASSRGTIEVNSASIRGTANIADGASVRTNQTASQINLENGVQLTLNQNTAAAVYDDRIELREGAAQIAARRAYGIDALGYRVQPANDSGIARVSYDQNRILVTAMDSPVKVSKDGVLVARVNAGTTYYFGQDEETGSAQSAGKTAGQGSAKSAGAAKGGLSSAAKWGIAAAVIGGGTAVGLGVALSGDDASR